MSTQVNLNDNENSLLNLEEDIDDETFLKTKYNKKEFDPLLNGVEDKVKLKLFATQEMEERIVKSSRRSLNMLQQSEEFGVATAAELLQQREQLERTEKLLDGVNSNLGISKTHIQGVQSVLFSIKHFLSRAFCGWPRSGLQRSEVIELPVVERSPTQTCLRCVQEETLDLLTFNEDVIGKQEIDKNLDEIMGSVVKLKGLARGLGDEIDSQNTLVEIIKTKADGVDIALEGQSKDINRLLQN